MTEDPWADLYAKPAAPTPAAPTPAAPTPVTPAPSATPAITPPPATPPSATSLLASKFPVADHSVGTANISIKTSDSYRDGGEVNDYRGGGKVKQGTTPTADDVPAMLSKGEYVLPADTVKAVGSKNLDHLRETSHNPANRAGTSHGKRGFK